MSQWKLTNDTDKIWLLRAQNVWWSVPEGTKLENIDLPLCFWNEDCNLYVSKLQSSTKLCFRWNSIYSSESCLAYTITIAGKYNSATSDRTFIDTWDLWPGEMQLGNEVFFLQNIKFYITKDNPEAPNSKVLHCFSITKNGEMKGITMYKN